MAYKYRQQPWLTRRQREQLATCMRSLGLAPSVRIEKPPKPASRRKGDCWKRALPRRLGPIEKRLLRRALARSERSNRKCRISTK